MAPYRVLAAGAERIDVTPGAQNSAFARAAERRTCRTLLAHPARLLRDDARRLWLRTRRFGCAPVALAAHPSHVPTAMQTPQKVAGALQSLVPTALSPQRRTPPPGEQLELRTPKAEASWFQVQRDRD